jgi:DNA-binding winged helix-turn-helix (wHTH) protein
VVKSPDGPVRFADFTLDAENRLLLRGGTPVELGGRYFDALVMLVRERGRLITKDRLHDEVWRGVPVTDEALSQAIMALRRALGDDAARPRFIETVPRHGYRFIATLGEEPSDVLPPATAPIVGRLGLVAGGIAGAAVAGLLVGLVYGGLAASRGPGSALSLVLVLVCLALLAALVSGLGIAGGIGLAMARTPVKWWQSALGGGLGGLVIGGFAGLLGLDTLRLLTGSAPERMTGAAEGVVIGLATGIAYWIATSTGRGPLARFAPATLLGGLGGLVIALGGGTLMAGSLAAMVARFPGAGLTLRWTEDWRLLAAAGVFEGAAFVTAMVAGLTRGRAA